MEASAEEEFNGFPTTTEPFDKGWLKVSDIHEIYYEVSGKVDGNPIIFIHGGPGAGCSPSFRQFFDPSVYRVIFMDQRGAGKSKPHAELRDNTTWDLVEDIEKLRQHLGIDRWVVFGGSWGSALSLVYTIKHTSRVKALIIGCIFTGRREETMWLYQKASFLFPDYWKDFISPIPLGERSDILSAYYRRLTSTDSEECMKAAKTWAQWELSVSSMTCDREYIKSKLEDEKWLLSFAKIECHYFVHGCWFDDSEYILNNIYKIKDIVPVTIIQGRYDIVCPMKTAWELHEKWPEAEFHVIKESGHSPMDPAIRTALIKAVDKYKNF